MEIWLCISGQQQADIWIIDGGQRRSRWLLSALCSGGGRDTSSLQPEPKADSDRPEVSCHRRLRRRREGGSRVKEKRVDGSASNWINAPGLTSPVCTHRDNSNSPIPWLASRLQLCSHLVCCTEIKALQTSAAAKKFQASSADEFWTSRCWSCM